MPQLIEVSHVSKKGASLRITIPKKAAEAMEIREGDIVGFYEHSENVILKKMK
ncbi:MAG: AbrB/MazE/SpoVT family DNA-binding domain-containing protein [Thermoplasmatales archaeon]